MSQDKKYTQLDAMKGHLFEYSGTPKEGFEKHTSKTGKESYRKYYPYGVEGTLNSVSVRDSNFGKELSIALEEGVYINFGLNDQKGNIDQYAEAMIKVLGQMKKGDKVQIAPYKFLPEGQKYDKTGITVKVNDEKVQGLTNAYYKDGKLVEGDVPAVIWKDDKLTPGKKKPDLASVAAKNDYLIDVLMEQAERLKWVGSAPTAPQQQSSQEDDHLSDLPF